MADGKPSIAEVEAATESIANANEQMKEVTQQVAKISEAFSKLGSSNVDIIKAFSSLGKETTGVVEQFGNVVEAVKETTTTLKGWKTVIDNVNDSIISTSQKLANALEKTRADYVKSSLDIAGSTGAIGEAMKQASKEMTIFGTNTSAATLAVTSMIPQVQANLEPTIKLAASFEALGVSSKTTTSNLNLFSDSMQISRANTAQSSEEMGKTILALTGMNKSLTESATLIQQNSDIIMIFGGEALVQLEGQAINTGIALDTLAAVSKKFDTFEGAAEQVGKLNALLGADYLGVTEMMYAEPADQVQMITNAFRDAGASVEGMDPIQKKFMAQTIQSTLGLKNQQEALKFLQADEFEQGRIIARNNEQNARSEEIQNNLNEALQKAMPALEQLSNAFNKLMSALTPLFELINVGVGYVAEFIQGVADLSKEHETASMIIGGLVLIGGAYLSFLFAAAIATTTVAAPIAALAPAAGLASTALGVLGPTAGAASIGVGELAVALLAVAASFALMGAGVALIGVGILAAAGGVYILAKAIQETGANILYIIPLMLGLSFSLYAIAPVALAAGPGLLMVGLAIGMIGTGIGQATAGITAMMTSISNIGANIDVILKLADAIDKIQGKALELRVNVTGDVEQLQAISKITVAATAPNTPATAAATERTIVIKEVYVRIDDRNSFKSTVTDMVFEDQRMQALIQNKTRP